MHHNTTKGTNMKLTEHSPKTPRVITGLFAMLASVFGVQGTGAPAVSQGTGASSAARPGRSNLRAYLAGFVATLCAFAAALTFAAAPALAVAPLEEPEVTSVESVFVTTATFQGVLEPAASEPTEAGSYKYVYDKGASCTGAGAVATTAGIALGEPGEALPAEPVSGLVSGTEYTVCLSVTNPSATKLSAPVHFDTPPIEAEASTPASVTVDSATLEGVVSAHAPGESGSTYQFVYRANPTECKGAGEVKAPASPGLSLGAEHEEVNQPIAGLAANTKYTVCLVVTNTAKAEVISVPVTFQTAPEAPEIVKVKAGSVTATSVEVEGVLDPKASTPVEGGEYQFAYRVSPTECEGEGAAPEPAGVALGHVKEAVGPVKLEHLQPNATYAVCLRERNAAGEPGVSAPVTLHTLAVAPAIEGESAPTPVSKATEARLEGVVNPNNEMTECHFEYGATSVSEHAVACEPPTLEGFGGQGVGVSVKSLSPGTTYKYQIVAKSAAGETHGTGTATFTTAITPEKPEGEKVKGGSIAATSAELEGTLNPKLKGDPGSYEFLYRLSATECENENATSAEPASGALEEAAGPVKLENLQPDAKYTFCLRAHNEVGEEATGIPVTFTTLAAPPKIDSEYTSAVKSTSAELEAQVNPNNEATKYTFEYSQTEAAKKLTGTIVKVPGTELPAGFGDQTASVATGVLSPATTYFYRVTAENTAGKAEGAVMSFTTTVAPEKPVTEAASGQTTTTATLRGVLSPSKPGKPGAYEFLYRQSPSECQGTGQETTAQEAMTGTIGQKVHAEISALTPGAEYTFCLLARNEAGETSIGNAVTFTTVVVPLAIEGESSSNVGSSGVTLSARLNPGGSPSTYDFEYGTSEAYGSLTPAQSLGAGSEVVGAQATVSALQPGALYHFRVVATNAKGETARGADATFTTFPAPIAGLPDGRVYERVTPEFPEDLSVKLPEEDNDEEAEYYGEFSTTLPFRAAADGSALAYQGTPTSEGGEGSDASGGDQYLAQRTATGWTNSLIQPRTGQRAKYEFFSSDLSVGIFQEKAERGELAPSERWVKLFVRNLSSGSDETLFDAIVPHREWYEFGTAGVAYNTYEDLLFAGASSDMSHKLFEANDALDPEAEEDPPSTEQNDLYDSYGGRLYLVNVLPDGKAAPGATFGGTFPSGNRSSAEVDFRNDISADGSRIFWTDMQDHDLYMRVNDTQPQSPLDGEGRCTVPADACTVQIDASQGPGSSGGGLFWGATPDGSRVFFTDCNRLTTSSTAVFSNAECGTLIGRKENVWGAEGSDLYEYDVETGKLTDLTVDTNASDALGANVQGVLGISEDGSYIYFVATGVLANGATAGQDNLYALHVGEPIRFVAALDEGDDGFPFYIGFPPGDWKAGVGDETAQVTPDGRHLIYLSNYTVHQIYMYDFGGGAPYCISCSPVGAPEGRQVTNFPVSYSDTYALRVMSSDGDRVFFETKNALVPQDTNGLNDVYEWERDGSGSCQLEKGCVYLLSSGSGDAGSHFIDASESGGDVFMVTTAQLGSQPQGEALHIVDAHVGIPLALTECTGSGCQGVPGAPPIFATPSSVTFEGVGNFAPGGRELTHPKQVTKKTTKCAKGKHRNAKGKCVKNKRRANKSNRAGDERRAKR
jgi:hypothetical protein